MGLTVSDKTSRKRWSSYCLVWAQSWLSAWYYSNGVLRRVNCYLSSRIWTLQSSSFTKTRGTVNWIYLLSISLNTFSLFWYYCSVFRCPILVRCTMKLLWMELSCPHWFELPQLMLHEPGVLHFSIFSISMFCSLCRLSYINQWVSQITEWSRSNAYIYIFSSFQERSKCLSGLIQMQKVRTTFEQFASNVFCPLLPTISFQSGIINRASGIHCDAYKMYLS